MQMIVTYFTSDDINHLYSKINSSLCYVFVWLNYNYLTLNLNTTEYAIISLKSINSKFKITVNNLTIQKSNSFKFFSFNS